MAEIPSDDTTKLGADQGDHISRLLSAFRDKLIDLTRRNRLINYRHSESSNTHIRIINCGLNDLAEASISGRQLEFVALPDPPAQTGDIESPEFQAAYEIAVLSDQEYLDQIRILNAEGSSDPDLLSQLEGSLKDRIRMQLGMSPSQNLENSSPTAIARAAGIEPSYELNLVNNDITQENVHRQVQTLFRSGRMEAKLGKIRDSARRSVEESGINRLFLAVGFLDWREAEHSERSNFAPLLVTPVTIVRQSASNKWRYFLQGLGEPFVENVALRLRLQIDNIDIPEYLEMGIGEYLDQVKLAIREKVGWSVHNFATVGLFSFSSLEIWSDLDPDKWPRDSLRKSSNVLSMFGSGELAGEENAEEYYIDSPDIANKIPPLILDADSSQVSVIIDALSGRSLAVKGPPGTGKSQTIANLISAALHSGKKVLFLAEKMAALEVVKSRLDDAGLGDFVLELHSSKAHTRNLVKGLNSRIQSSSPNQPPTDIEPKIEQLESLKQQLNEYVAILNEPASKAGRTINEVLWAAQNRRTVFSNRAFRDLDIANAEFMGAADLERAESALLVMEDAIKSIEQEYTDLQLHPWSWIDLPPVIVPG